MLGLHPSCITAISQCLGGQFFCGPLKATCKSIALALPAIYPKFDHTEDFLKYIVQHDHLHICEQLLSQCSFLNKFKGKLFKYVGKYCKLDMCKKLFEDNVTYTYLYANDTLVGAASSGCVEICRMMKNSTSSFEITATINLCRNHHEDLLPLLIPNPNSLLMLNGFAKGGRMDKLRFAEKAEHWNQLYIPLFESLNILAGGIIGGHLEVCKYAVEELGVNVHHDGVSSLVSKCKNKSTKDYMTSKIQQ